MALDENFVNELAAEFRKIGTIHSVGEEWISYIGNGEDKIPAGGLPYFGTVYTRAVYKDLWEHIQQLDSKRELILTDDDWLAYESSHGGNVPYYSSGDGSTTFRVPKIVGYLKSTSNIDNLGKYIAEGLPNITGSPILGEKNYSSVPEPTGAIYKVNAGNAYAGSNDSDNDYMAFDASRSNPIYGNSQHVTPETSLIVMGVYAYGVVINTGALDATTLATAVQRVEAKADQVLNDTVTSVQGHKGDVHLMLAKNPDPVKANSVISNNTTYTYTVPLTGVAVVTARAGSGRTQDCYHEDREGEVICDTVEDGNTTLTVKINGTTVYNSTVKGSQSYSSGNRSFNANDVITVYASRTRNNDVIDHTFSYTQDATYIM